MMEMNADPEWLKKMAALEEDTAPLAGDPAPAPKQKGFGVGMPTLLYLEQFGSVCWDAFGRPPYLVGSCLQSKTAWRDVDVRLILDDDEYDAMFGTDVPLERMNGKWAAFCMAFSELGRKMTGLPIDFQIQRRTQANEKFDGPRSALGILELRMKR
jgi:hypothetical protein